MDKLLKQVQSTINEYNMLKPNDEVLVGLSGGADSVALVCALDMLGYSVFALHLNHGIRGEEADRDAKFCTEFCKRRNIHLEMYNEDVLSYAKKKGQSVETAAREIRYSLFEKAAKGKKIATAHNAGDTLETILFNLARGTGLTGLCGIPPIRGNIIRPLICCTREEIEHFLTEINEKFVVDSTNLNDDYTRNIIRHNAVPVMKKINKNAEKSAVFLGQRLKVEDDFINKTALSVLEKAKCEQGWDINEILSQHIAIIKRAAKEMCRQSGVKMSELNEKHIDALVSLMKNKNPSARISLPSDKTAKRKYNIIVLKQNTPKNDKIPHEIPLKVPFEGVLWHGATNVSIELLKKNQYFYKTLNTFWIDCDTIDVSSCVLRTRKVGDKLRLTQNGGSKTLKKLLIEKKIPYEKRDSLIVLADKNGVIAAECIGVDVNHLAKGEKTLVIKFKG